LDTLNKRELVTKANEALEKMVGQIGQGPSKPAAVGAKRLQNGGVVYKLDSPETAAWICKEKVAFTNHFSAASVVKDKAVSVLIEYVPVAHNPDTLAENRNIECDSRISADTLLAMRWIKPVHRRTPRQCTAHVIARFKMADAANHTIQDRVLIAGKRVWMRRLCKEARRCHKCQALGTNHLAANCMQADSCSMCGGEHRTADCAEECTNFFCISCNETGNASCSHLCPSFIEECKKAERMDPEWAYRFFPGQEAWTWEQEGGYEGEGARGGREVLGRPRGESEKMAGTGRWNVVSTADE